MVLDATVEEHVLQTQKKQALTEGDQTAGIVAMLDGLGVTDPELRQKAIAAYTAAKDAAVAQRKVASTGDRSAWKTPFIADIRLAQWGGLPATIADRMLSEGIEALNITLQLRIADSGVVALIGQSVAKPVVVGAPRTKGAVKSESSLGPTLKAAFPDGKVPAGTHLVAEYLGKRYDAQRVTTGYQLDNDKNVYTSPSTLAEAVGTHTNGREFWHLAKA